MFAVCPALLPKETPPQYVQLPVGLLTLLSSLQSQKDIPQYQMELLHLTTLSKSASGTQGTIKKVDPPHTRMRELMGRIL